MREEEGGCRPLFQGISNVLKNEPKLKPCPFCGNKCYLIPTDKWKLDEDLTMVCNHCQMEFRGYGVKFSEEALLVRWNNRNGGPKKCCANCKHHERVEIQDGEDSWDYYRCKIKGYGVFADKCPCEYWEGVE